MNATKAFKFARSMTGMVDGNLRLVGHSLSGGLATQGGAATGLRATTFNPASLGHVMKNDKWVGGKGRNLNRSIDMFAVKGEFLTAAQDWASEKTFGEITKAQGERTYLDPQLEGGTLRRHQIDHACAALEVECECN